MAPPGGSLTPNLFERAQAVPGKAVQAGDTKLAITGFRIESVGFLPVISICADFERGADRGAGLQSRLRQHPGSQPKYLSASAVK